MRFWRTHLYTSNPSPSDNPAGRCNCTESDKRSIQVIHSNNQDGPTQLDLPFLCAQLAFLFCRTTEERKSCSEPSIRLSHEPKRRKVGTKRRNRNEGCVRLRVPARLNRGTLPITDRRNRPMQDWGNCPLATVSHSVEKERRQKGMNSTGERATRLPKATHRPSISLTFPSPSSLSYEHPSRPLLIHPFQPPNHSLTSQYARFRGSRALVR